MIERVEEAVAKYKAHLAAYNQRMAFFREKYEGYYGKGNGGRDRLQPHELVEINDRERILAMMEDLLDINSEEKERLSHECASAGPVQRFFLSL